ncbi:MAG TPA: hypothetical protein VML75_26855 [Kofleriaceae bacterium]|nr:hypothetical protein [Kofleriaceae bacterium]
MLARDVLISDLDGRHWANWLGLLMPHGVMDAPRFAVLWIHQGAPIKCVVRGAGAIPLDQVPFEGTSQGELVELRKALEVDAVIVLDRDALAEVFTAIDRNLDFEADYVAQSLTMLRAVKQLAGAGIWSEPRLLEIVPAPPFEALQRTFDLLIPNNSSLLAYVFEDDHSDIHASIIATKAAGHIDAVATHKVFEDMLPGPRLARTWRAQHKRVLELTAERFGRPAVDVFLDRRTYYRILTGPTDTLTRELRARNIIIDPAPAWLLGLLGGATVAAVATRGARAFARYLPDGARKMAAGFAQQAQDMVSTSNANPWALLGFDPIELWLRTRHFYRHPS